MKNRMAAMRGTEQAVSETIGFVLIFSIVMAGIGLVTLYGYPMLLKQQAGSDEQIMEKNMIVLQNDIKSLAYKTVPYKETSLKVGGGALTVYNMSYEPSSSFRIYDDAGTIAPASDPQVFHTGDLRYESASAQTGISLENGAVVLRKTAQAGSVMLAEPRWFYDSSTNTAVIYMIGFNSSELMSRNGIGTVKMTLGETDFREYDTSGDRVYIQYHPNADADYSIAWDTYFAQSLGMDSCNGDWYCYQTNPAKLVIIKNEIVVKSV